MDNEPENAPVEETGEEHEAAPMEDTFHGTHDA